TRSPAHTLALLGKPAGVGCQKAPESSSNRTNLPALKTLPFCTLMVEAPLVPSAVSFCDLVLSGPGQRDAPMMTSGCGSGLYVPGLTGCVGDIRGRAPSVF